MAATGGLVRRKSIVGSNSQIPSIFLAYPQILPHSLRNLQMVVTI